MGGRSFSSSLSYLNSLLCSLGINPFPSQFVLLAAANHPSATGPVLACLSDLIVFHLALPPLPDTNTPHSQSNTQHKHANVRIDPVPHARDERNGHYKNHSNVVRQGPLTLVDVMPDSSASQEEKLSFVKFYLAMWGYAPTSPFFTLNSETNESRHFLLALGWLISHCDVFNRALEKRFSVFMGKNTDVVTHTYLGSLAMDKGRAAITESEQYVAKVFAASDRLRSDSRAKAKALGEQVLMLCGRLRMTLRSLYAVISCKAKRSHELNQMQLKDNVRGPEGHPFSPFELHLLEHHKTLEKYFVTLEMTKCMVKELVACNQHERNFWQWIGEVATEARLHVLNEDSMSEEDKHITTASGVWTTNLLPVINYFRTELKGLCTAEGISHLQTAPQSEWNSNSKMVVSQVDLISTPIMAVWKDIQERSTKATTMSCFGTNNEDLVAPDPHFLGAFSSLQNHLLPEESTRKSEHVQQCLDETQFERFSIRLVARTQVAVKLIETFLKAIMSIKDIATMLVSTLAKIRVKNRAVIQEALKVSMENKDHLFAGV